MICMNVMPANPFDQVSVGVSLSQSAIRMVVVDSKHNLKSTVEAPLPAGAFGQSTINVNLIAETLTQLVKQVSLPSPYVVVTLPEYYSYTRSHQIPQMPLEDVSEALGWQLEKILPLPKESVYFDWKLISRENKELKVLVIAMARETLDTLIQVFEKAGLKPISFEPSASALSRILPLEENMTSILIEISPNGSSATLVENQISYLTITSQFISGTPEQTKVALQKTSDAVQSLIQYCQNKRQEPAELKLLLTGDGASNEVAQWFQTLLNRPVLLLQLPNVPPHFHQAFAAATISLLPEDRSVDVNLLPDTLRKFYDTSRLYQKTFSQFKWSWVISGISLGLSVMGLILSLNQVRNSSQELLNIENSNSTYSYNSQEIIAINQSSQAIVNLFPQKNTPVDKFESLFGVTNQYPGIKLINLGFKKETNELIISGSASTRTDLLDYVDAIKQIPAFRNTDLPVTALEKPSNINFTLNIVLQS